MNLRNIAVVLSANTTSFRSQIAMAAHEVDSFDKRVGSSATGLEKMGKVAAVATKAGILAVAVSLGTAVAAAASFETRMRNVNSISHLSEQAFRAQNQAVLDMSKQFPQSANTLAEGLYDIASSGFQAEKGMMVLEASAKAASAGMSDTATSAKAITAVLNAYGLEAEEANRVGNVLFQGVNVGVMSFEELAGAIGSVVGTAAAAGVNIEDLTAGIATMTLSGISADEAATSMNRTLQGLIDPSDALSASISALGYESGVSMLKTLGLHGTMEKLREITGGNIEVLLRYFPEIRAARGALALMSAEGENYNKVQKSMNDAQRDGGAMQATFREQMKSTSAQVAIVKNNVMAFAVTVGTTVLPYIRDGIKEVKGFTNELVDLGREGRDRLEPFFRNLRPLLDNTKVLFGDLADVVEPVAAAFGALVAVGLIEALNGISSALVATTGLLVEHKEVLAAVAAFYGVQMIAAIFAAGGAFDVLALKALYARDAMAASGVVATLQSIAAGAYAVSAAFATEGIVGGAAAITAMVNPMVLLGVAAAAVAGTFVMIAQEEKKLVSAGRKGVDEWMDGFDVANERFSEVQFKYQDFAGAIESVQKKQKELNEDMSSADKAMRALGYDDLKGLKEQEKLLKDLQAEYGGYIEVVKQVSHETGMTWDEANKAVSEQGFKVEELSSKTEKGQKKQAEAIRETVEASKKATAETLWGLGQVQATQDEMNRLAGLAGEEFEAEAGRIMETANAAAEFAKKVGEAWSSQQDVVAALGDKVEVTGGEILKWYKTMIDDGEEFAENIRKAIEMGYDPSLIARTIEAGPAQAGPLLEQMVNNQGQHFIDSVNQSERALTELNAKAVELARLTNRAMTAESDIMARDLQKAMAISTIIMATGGKSTMKALTDQLGVGEDEVTRIANEYGISLAAALDPIRGATGLPPIPHASRGGRNFAIAAGGYVDPAVWGDTNADTVPAWVMPGEVVIKKESVKKAGLKRLLAVNETGEFPGYKDGGLVGLGFPDYPPGSMGDTSEAASAQTYMKAVAAEAARGAAAMAATGGGGGPVSRGSNVTLGQAMAAAVGWTGSNWTSLLQMWTRESGWNEHADNPTSSAYGIPQALPGSKMASAGRDWHDNPATQIRWGLGYIRDRYGSPDNAWRFWQTHHWYGDGGLVHKNPWDSGGTAEPGWNLINNTTGGPETLRPVGFRDVMPQVSVNVNVYIGDTQLRGIIRQEVTLEQDKQNRRQRSMADA